MASQSWIFGSPQSYTVLKVNNEDRTDYLVMGSLNISDELTNKINTASFRTYDIDGTWVPDTSDVISIIDFEGNEIFAGYIVSANETRIGIDPTTHEEILGYAVRCQDYTKMLQKKLIIETYKNKTCKQILTEMRDKYFPTEGITLSNVEDGPVIENFTFNYAPGDQAISALANAVGYQWFIDYAKDIHFFSQSTSRIALEITDDTDNWTDLRIDPDTSQLRNRVFVRGGIYYSDPYTQYIVADGEQEEFLLAYTPDDENFTVTVASVQRTVGLDNIDEAEDYDFLLNRKEKALKMGESTWAQANTPMTADTLLTTVYNYEIPVLIVQEDSDSINAMKNIEGGDGIYEYVVIDENITSIQAARTRAYAELRDYANPVIKGSVKSYECYGIRSGDIVSINSTRRGINTQYLVQSVKMKQIATDKIEYTISFSGRLYGLVDVLISLFKQTQRIVLGLDEVLDAFTALQDSLGGIYHNTPTITDGAPPYKWSDDAGTTSNKARWSLAEWDS